MTPGALLADDPAQALDCLAHGRESAQDDGYFGGRKVHAFVKAAVGDDGGVFADGGVGDIASVDDRADEGITVRIFAEQPAQFNPAEHWLSPPV